MDFLKCTLACETTFEVRNVGLGGNTSTIHISLTRGRSEKAAAYATCKFLPTAIPRPKHLDLTLSQEYEQMSDEKGVTYPTEDTLSLEPCPTDTPSLFKNQDPLWISFSNHYDSNSFAESFSRYAARRALAPRAHGSPPYGPGSALPTTSFASSPTGGPTCTRISARPVRTVRWP